MRGDLLVLSETPAEMLGRFPALNDIRMLRVLRRDIEITNSEIGKFVSAIWYEDRDPYGFYPPDAFPEGYYFLCPDGRFMSGGLVEADSVTDAVMMFDDSEGAFKAAQLAATNKSLKYAPDCLAVLSLVAVDEGVCAEAVFAQALDLQKP